MTKAWLTMMAVIAGLGTALSIYLMETGHFKEGLSLIENGAILLAIMAFTVGIVNVIKYVEEN